MGTACIQPGIILASESARRLAAHERGERSGFYTGSGTRLVKRRLYLPPGLPAGAFKPEPACFALLFRTQPQMENALPTIEITTSAPMAHWRAGDFAIARIRRP